MASGVSFTMAAWCVQMRGPIFVSAFNPLTLVVGVFAAALLLDEKLHLGRSSFSHLSNQILITSLTVNFYRTLYILTRLRMYFADCSVLGGVIIICGLYVVLWGKRNEMRKIDQLIAC